MENTQSLKEQYEDWCYFDKPSTPHKPDTIEGTVRHIKTGEGHTLKPNTKPQTHSRRDNPKAPPRKGTLPTQVMSQGSTGPRTGRVPRIQPTTPRDTTTEYIQSSAGRPKKSQTKSTPNSIANEARRKVGRPRKTSQCDTHRPTIHQATTTREPEAVVVKRKVGRPSKTSYNITDASSLGAETDVGQARQKVGRPRKESPTDTKQGRPMDRTKRHVKFDFSNGVVERPYKHDTRSMCPGLTRRARKFLASDQQEPVPEWQTKTKED
jgi:hypothetical protein